MLCTLTTKNCTMFLLMLHCHFLAFPPCFMFFNGAMVAHVTAMLTVLNH